MRTKYWTCPICHTDLLRQHRARHLESKSHQVRVGITNNNPAESDKRFALFLETINPRNFTGYEARLYAEITGSLNSNKWVKTNENENKTMRTKWKK